MIDLTPEANTRFEQYLERMRSALRGSRAVEATEVEQNVREHVEIALAGVTAPVGAEQLGAVLEQLGPPDRWLTEDDRPWWRRIAYRISNGPADWRLAYLAFGAFAMALLLLPVGIGILVLICSFLLSRATVDLITERGEALGARKWLVLPAIWVVLLLIAGPILIIPVVGASAWALSDGGIEMFGVQRPAPESIERVRIEAGFVGMAAGAWWLVLSMIFAAVMKPFRSFFLPVTANLSRKHAAVLALVGLMVGAIGAVLLFVV